MSEVESLKSKTINGVGWSAIDNIVQYSVSFLVGIVLARLLTPDDYGLIGIITIFTSICATIVNGGFSNALIRKKNTTEDDYNTVFIVNVVVSIGLYFLIYIFAPYISIYFRRDELLLLTRVASLSIIIGSLAIVPQTKLSKHIDFKAQTRITIIVSTISGIVGITMALLDFGVWSLVFQTLLNSLLRTVLLWVYNKWIPKFAFSFESFKELFGFGWKLLISFLLDNIWKQLNQVVIGRYYSPASLGQYTRANSFSELLSSNLTSVVQRVTFPVLSSIQDDNTRLISAYRKIIKTAVFITSNSMFFLGAIAKPLVYCLIGPKWEESAMYLPLICIYGSLYPLHAINLNMLQVQGRSDLFLILEVFKKIIGILPLVIGIYMGILPMLFFTIITGIICYFLNSYFPGKILGYGWKEQLYDVLPFYVISFFIAIPIWALKFIPISYWIILPLQIVIWLGIVCTFYRAIKLPEFHDISLCVMAFIQNNLKFSFKHMTKF